jgi:Glucodextranase, domain B
MYLRKIFFIILISLFTLSIFTYGFYKALPLILGPKVVVNYPNQGENVNGTTVAVRGVVSRAKELYVNGIATGFSENGIFETRLAVYPPHSIIFIVAKDKFGRSHSVTLNIGSK